MTEKSSNCETWISYEIEEEADELSVEPTQVSGTFATLTYVSETGEKSTGREGAVTS